jgi:hypothetical protein
MSLIEFDIDELELDEREEECDIPQDTVKDQLSIIFERIRNSSPDNRSIICDDERMTLTYSEELGFSLSGEYTVYFVTFSIVTTLREDSITINCTSTFREICNYSCEISLILDNNVTQEIIPHGTHPNGRIEYVDFNNAHKKLLYLIRKYKSAAAIQYMTCYERRHIEGNPCSHNTSIKRIVRYIPSTDDYGIDNLYIS